MPTNWYMFLLAGLIPFLVGGIYYGPLFGKAWMKVNKFTEEDLKGTNMGVLFLLSFLFSCMLAMMFSSMVIHQSSVWGLLNPEVAADGMNNVKQDMIDFMAKYGDRHRTASHGAAHGLFTSIFFVFPLISIVSLFERRGWKYILIHFGYWAITLVLMGALLCSTLKFPPIS